MQKEKLIVSEQVDSLIKDANNVKASDIHFHPVDKGARIYFRLDKKLIFQKEISSDLYNKVVRYTKFKAKLQIGERILPQDGEFNIYFNNDESLNLMVSTIPLYKCECMVIRIISHEIDSAVDTKATEPTKKQKT